MIFSNDLEIYESYHTLSRSFWLLSMTTFYYVCVWNLHLWDTFDGKVFTAHIANMYTKNKDNRATNGKDFSPERYN